MDELAGRFIKGNSEFDLRDRPAVPLRSIIEPVKEKSGRSSQPEVNHPLMKCHAADVTKEIKLSQSCVTVLLLRTVQQ
jgi:hypothetical protein